jgi:peptide subunit release factor RF-3
MANKSIENEKKISRSIKIQFDDGTTKIIELDKRNTIKSNVGILHFDKISNSRWQLTWSADIIEEFSKIKSFNIIREEDCGKQPSVPEIL